MRYLLKQVEQKFIEKKSEFIGILYPVTSDEDMALALKDAKMRYPKATHYVTANIRGKRGEYASSNDDGEPSRTAGYPALSVLMKHNITDIFFVAVRYYGGIQLGAGGLIRAYSKAAVIALEAATFYEKVVAKKYKITFNYNLVDNIDHLLDDKFRITDKVYLENVCYTFIILEGTIDSLNDIRHQLLSLVELPEEILNINVE